MAGVKFADSLQAKTKTLLFRIHYESAGKRESFNKFKFQKFGAYLVKHIHYEATCCDHLTHVFQLLYAERFSPFQAVFYLTFGCFFYRSNYASMRRAWLLGWAVCSCDSKRVVDLESEVKVAQFIHQIFTAVRTITKSASNMI